MWFSPACIFEKKRTGNVLEELEAKLARKRGVERIAGSRSYSDDFLAELNWSGTGFNIADLAPGTGPVHQATILSISRNGTNALQWTMEKERSS